MESSEFSVTRTHYDSVKPLGTAGASSDAFCVKLYGKLHFLKRLKAEHAADIRYQEAFRKEFETGYRLEHPRLVRYIALEGNDMLMEYVDGETLTQRLASQPDYFKSKKNTEKFAHQLLDGVGYLHSHQVLHLDLKPSNIMLTHIGNDVKLIDLGCCYTDTFVDTTGRTNDFAAPEQLAGGKVDVRTDIYAIGKILSLFPPCQRYAKVANRCMASNPDDRYQSVEELQHALRNHREIMLPLAVGLPLMAIVGFVFLFRGCSPEVVLQATDTSPVADAVVAVDTPLVVQPSTHLTQQSNARPAKQEDQIARMKKEMAKMMNKAYKATIASFCDSVFPSPSVGMQWASATEDYHRRVNEMGDVLAKKYPDIPETEIRQDLENQFQSLVGYVFGRMRENGEN